MNLVIIPAIEPRIAIPNIKKGDSRAGSSNVIGILNSKLPRYGKITSDREPIITEIITADIKARKNLFLYL